MLFCSIFICRLCLDQTPEEIERTKQFSYEVIDLLKNCPQCTMVFNKFIPSYHHHFGRQCRVADYGFSKLLELFEAIPDIVNVSYVILFKFGLTCMLGNHREALFHVTSLHNFPALGFCITVYFLQSHHHDQKIPTFP